MAGTSIAPESAPGPASGSFEAVELRVEDPAELCSGEHPFEGDMSQLGRGKLDGAAVGFLGEGIDVWLYHLNRPTFAVSALRSDLVVLSTPVEMDGPVRFNGAELHDGDVIEHVPGRENNERFGAGLYLDIQLSAGKARALGIVPGATPLRGLSTSVLSRIRSYGEQRLGLRDAATGEGRPDDDDFLAGLLAVLDGDGLALRVLAPSPRSHQLLTRAIERIDRADEGDRISVGDLAASLGVSERTLYLAFRNEIGTSPYDYVLTRRLNRLRRLLLNEPRSAGLVTRSAMRLGFDHLGQMGRLYKRLFGETPRETVRRRS